MVHYYSNNDYWNSVFEVTFNFDNLKLLKILLCKIYTAINFDAKAYDTD